MKEGLVCQTVSLVLSINVMDASPLISRTLNNTVERIDANRDWAWLTEGEYEPRLMEGETGGDWQCCVCVFSQCTAGHGRARLCRDVPGETSAAPVWSVCLRVSSEYAQSRASVYGHQCDSLTEESKGEFYISISPGVCLMTLLFDEGAAWTHNISILYTSVVIIFILHIAYFFIILCEPVSKDMFQMVKYTIVQTFEVGKILCSSMLNWFNQIYCKNSNIVYNIIKT